MEAWVRETKRKTLSFLHHIQAKADNYQVNDKLEHYDPQPIHNTAPSKVKTVLFIITRMVRFAGGQTSVLRLGSQLVKQGYQVGYIVYKTQSKAEMEICASSNLEGYQGSLFTKKELKKFMDHPEKQPDVVIATSWDTVSFAKALKNSYRMYFVQDYEPYFYSFGELFLMAKKTYEQGLHMVSLGDWNIEQIKKDCHVISPLDRITFPYERSEYHEIGRCYEAYAKKRKLVMAVYLKFYGKRLPCIIQNIAVKLKKEFKNIGIELVILYYGEAKSFQPKGGKNLGMLSKKELAKLYEYADFGMIASMSNISLVPYEMLATGLPLIEFEDGTFPYFFPEDTALLTSISYLELFEKLKECLRNPKILKRRNQRAQEFLKNLSWEQTGGEMALILEKIKA